jgi:hypothetical protein
MEEQRGRFWYRLFPGNRLGTGLGMDLGLGFRLAHQEKQELKATPKTICQSEQKLQKFLNTQHHLIVTEITRTELDRCSILRSE